MPLAQEERRRRQIQLRPRAGHFEQRIHVGIARLRDLDDPAIHRLFARQLNFAEQPPDGGMEPERGAHQFLGHREKPVAPLHVQVFVAQDGLLHGVAQLWKPLRQQDHRPAPAESHRARNLGRKQHLGPHARVFERPGMAAVTAQSPEPHAQPSQARHHTGGEQTEQQFAWRDVEARRRRRGNRDAGHHRRHRDAGGDHFPVPGPHPRQQQACRQQQLPVEQPRAGRAHANQRGHESRHRYQQPHLQAVRQNVAPDQRGAHDALPGLRSRAISSRSSRDRSPSSTK